MQFVWSGEVLCCEFRFISQGKTLSSLYFEVQDIIKHRIKTDILATAAHYGQNIVSSSNLTHDSLD
jgi:hypothetical protein